MKSASEFDSFAGSYEADLDQALSVSGENQDYFARARVAWLSGCLRQLQQQPRSALDYGCGIGGTSVFLRELLGVEQVVGLDVSERSLERARREHGANRVEFLTFDQHVPREQVDLVYCNGVFHHIPPRERRSAVDYIYRSLRPGGWFALWENNPWNPGTRYVMSQCAFDRDAVTLTPPEAARLLQAGGLRVLRTDFLFVFPRFLKFLRVMEPGLARLPLGAQYQVLCRKPG